MIRHRTRLRPRKIDKEIRAGKDTYEHRPARVAAADFVQKTGHRNPWRPGTWQAKEYDRTYAMLEANVKCGDEFVSDCAVAGSEERPPCRASGQHPADDHA